MPDAPLPPELLRIAEQKDALDELGAALIGRAARLHLPLNSQAALRRQATALRILASRLEILSCPRANPSERRALIDARLAIEAAKAEIEPRKRSYPIEYQRIK